MTKKLGNYTIKYSSAYGIHVLGPAGEVLKRGFESTLKAIQWLEKRRENEHPQS